MLRMRSICFENMALAVTEAWIRERVRLSHNNLEDVRSLSLPGTYHEKISSLGDSLRNFTRLKSLDLSRNAIESLQGLENLKMLEKLVLYYNNVPSLQELYRLRYNQHLQELDLRLNPVARNEPDYRLFLIHMLPNLRRLDDRAVRDSERKAALMHFTSDQANELSQHPLRPPTSQPSSNPRVELVKSLAKPPSAVDQDEAVLLDYAGKTTAELLAPRKLTGSTSTQPHVEEYPPHVARHMDCAQEVEPQRTSQSENTSVPFPEVSSSGYMTNTVESMPPTTSSGAEVAAEPLTTNATQPGAILLPQVAEDLQKKYPNLMGPALQQRDENNDSKQYGFQLQVPKISGTKEDDNLKYQDEIEAYTSYKSQGHFTPHPETAPEQIRTHPSSGDETQKAAPSSSQKTKTSTTSYECPVISASAELYPKQNKQPEAPPTQSEVPAPGGVRVENQTDEQSPGPFTQFLTQISSLADKYWNGSNSLLKNDRFKNHLASIYQDLTAGVSTSGFIPTSHPSSDQLARLQKELREAEEENRRLRERTLARMEGMDIGEESKDKGTLIRLQRDLSILRSRLQKSLEENKVLQEKIVLLESGHGQRNGDSTLTATEGELGNIEKENERLRNEIVSLNIRLKQASQMQELAAMLQESHKSLVQTNDHLLRELEETRHRHLAEVKQLHWSYDQLKKAVNMSQYSQGGATKAHNGAT